MCDAFTKYRTLTNKELLLELDQKRSHSPIVDELCYRLGCTPAHCPVCEADITKARKELD